MSNHGSKKIVGGNSNKAITTTDNEKKVGLDVISIDRKAVEQTNDALQNIAEVLHRIEFILKGIGE